VFVPRYTDATKCDGDDDGYLITFVYDDGTNRSEVGLRTQCFENVILKAVVLAKVVVYDARTMSSVPVFRVILPDRVPFGFHGLWVDEDQLQRQALEA
jgi:carotenoid cleavage dioxygenase